MLASNELNIICFKKHINRWYKEKAMHFELSYWCVWFLPHVWWSIIMVHTIWWSYFQSGSVSLHSVLGELWTTANYLLNICYIFVLICCQYKTRQHCEYCSDFDACFWFSRHRLMNRLVSLSHESWHDSWECKDIWIASLIN